MSHHEKLFFDLIWRCLYYSVFIRKKKLSTIFFFVVVFNTLWNVLWMKRKMKCVCRYLFRKEEECRQTNRWPWNVSRKWIKKANPQLTQQPREVNFFLPPWRHRRSTWLDVTRNWTTPSTIVSLLVVFQVFVNIHFLFLFCSFWDFHAPNIASSFSCSSLPCSNDDAKTFGRPQAHSDLGVPDDSRSGGAARQTFWTLYFFIISKSNFF